MKIGLVLTLVPLLGVLAYLWWQVLKGGFEFLWDSLKERQWAQAAVWLGLIVGVFGILLAIIGVIVETQNIGETP
jgi:ABC-type sulfate transport system permease subunit